MKPTLKTVLTVAVLLGLSVSLKAIPPGTGSQHIRFTGFEEIVAPPMPAEDGWMSLTTQFTLTIPSLKVDGLKLTLAWLYAESPTQPDGTFQMYGAGYIVNEANEAIGSASFMNSGRYLSGPPVVEWYADGTVVGTIWAGPYAGMVLTTNANLHAIINVATGEEILYDSTLDGFLLASDNVGPEALKALKKQ